MAAKRRTKKATPTPEDQAPELIDGTDEQRADAACRAKECGQEIAEALAKYGCNIVPILNSELVGQSGQKVLIWATYSVIPMVVE